MTLTQVSKVKSDDMYAIATPDFLYVPNTYLSSQSNNKGDMIHICQLKENGQLANTGQWPKWIHSWIGQTYHTLCYNVPASSKSSSVSLYDRRFSRYRRKKETRPTGQYWPTAKMVPQPGQAHIPCTMLPCTNEPKIELRFALRPTVYKIQPYLA